MHEQFAKLKKSPNRNSDFFVEKGIGQNEKNSFNRNKKKKNKQIKKYKQKN